MAYPACFPPLTRARCLALLALVLECALALRVLAAGAVQWHVDRRLAAKGKICLFADAQIYWDLGGAIEEGRTYQVMQYDVPHFALRTPAYPAFLAACRLLFGDRLLPARLVQAVLGAATVGLLAWLVERVSPWPGVGWPVSLLAAALAAVEPFLVGTSALLLSEALFLPLSTLMLACAAMAWPATGTGRRWWAWAFGAGVSAGLAVLSKPSWALFPPLLALAWLVLAGQGRRKRAFAGGLLMGLGLTAAMAPWWVRNAEVFGRFVPTALWMGASLYDGLSPTATGASDMRFLDAGDLIALDERAQDAELTRRSLAFARANPSRVLELAAIKARRFWSPWPNAEEFGSRALAVASATVTLPVYALMLAGVWDRRRDARALVLLAGPLLYFAALHMVFVSSMRYRVAGLVPALGLAAIGLGRLLDWGLPRARGEPPPDAG
ncbi:glycosyltransferase family 39 protein [Isosphaeraceae bacterium EP7]